ncbi:hypothetical protein HD554DRAFT_1687926 [Boletus coccyginus]|nr:hypothetical protein HD554DRAFT_1687926 [Boletus coccyginus]
MSEQHVSRLKLHCGLALFCPVPHNLRRYHTMANFGSAVVTNIKEFLGVPSDKSPLLIAVPCRNAFASFKRTVCFHKLPPSEPPTRTSHMLFNKLALTLLGIVAAVAALPTSSTNIVLDTDGVVKRAPDVDGPSLSHRGCSISHDGTQHIGCRELS